MPFEIELARSGVVVDVPGHRTIFEVLRPMVPGLSFNCLRGECGTCVQTLLAGVPCHHDDVLSSRAKVAGRRIIICVSRAKSDRLVLDL